MRSHKPAFIQEYGHLFVYKIISYSLLDTLSIHAFVLLLFLEKLYVRINIFIL